MNRQKDKEWVLIFLIVFIAGLCLAAFLVIWIDPLFHYHAPMTDQFFYILDHERSINDGITRHFQYTGMITGSSMTENFKTSEAEEWFGGSFIKVPSFNSGYREINEIIERAFRRNPSLNVVIRGVDLDFVLVDKDSLRYGESFFPTYLYDDQLLNDIKYVLNRDILFSWTCGMLSDSRRLDYIPGITNFDDYAIWYQLHSFGKKAVCPDGLENPVPGQAIHLTEEQEASVLASCRQNLTDLPDQYPDAIFQFHSDWLGLQSLDIFIPSLSIGIEYQGLQHYEPVPFFGGEEGLNNTQERDRKKRSLCEQNGVHIIYWRYDETITASRL